MPERDRALSVHWVRERVPASAGSEPVVTQLSLIRFVRTLPGESQRGRRHALLVMTAATAARSRRSRSSAYSRSYGSDRPFSGRFEPRTTSRKRVVHQLLAPRVRGRGRVQASMIAQFVGCSLGCSQSQLGSR